MTVSAAGPAGWIYDHGDTRIGRVGSGVITVRPTNNIYTALALASFVSMLVALGYTIWRFHEMGAL